MQAEQAYQTAVTHVQGREACAQLNAVLAQFQLSLNAFPPSEDNSLRGVHNADAGTRVVGALQRSPSQDSDESDSVQWEQRVVQLARTHAEDITALADANVRSQLLTYQRLNGLGPFADDVISCILTPLCQCPLFCNCSPVC